MNIFFLEAYYSGSHAYFCDELTWALSQRDLYRHKNKEVQIFKFTLPGRHWRARLQLSHIELAAKINQDYQKQDIPAADIIITTSLTDNAALKGLLHQDFSKAFFIHYMHENQMGYPLDKDNPAFKKDHLFAQHVYPSYHLNQALACDSLIFNSHFHQKSFMELLRSFLKGHPVENHNELLESIKMKTVIIPIGLQFPNPDSSAYNKNLLPFHKRPKRLLWNHRWEYDKNPRGFFKKVAKLIEAWPHLEVSLLGQGNLEHDDFLQFKKDYGSNIIQYGGFPERKHYFKELENCRLLPVTSNHDFLGLATLEAIIYGVVPLLPNRLVYPELIPQELHHKLLYEETTGHQDFNKKALALLEEGLSPQEQALLQRHMQQFSWEHIISCWEKLFPPKNVSTFVR